MFDDLIRELRRMEKRTQIPISLILDEKGYLDRLCPNSECNADFKVRFEDWRDKVSDEIVYCPICGFQANATEWNTEAQQNQIQSVAVHHIQKQLDKAFTAGTRRFNHSQPHDSFISISLTYRPSPLPVIVPAQASEEMRQQSTCEACSCCYSSIGAAFFCPACGHNSADSTFDSAVDTVRNTLANLSGIHKALTEAVDRDTAENSVRYISENSLVKLVSAFQRLAEALFDKLPNRALFNPRRNLFQNLQESSDMWRSAIGQGYHDMLDAAEYTNLKRYFQQRHLLAHKEGMVDQEYLDRSGDHQYSIGQRLVIRRSAIDDLAVLVTKLADELRKHV